MISVWPSIIYVGLMLFGWGSQKDWSLSWVVAQIIVTGLLWWGGFFDPILTKIM